MSDVEIIRALIHRAWYEPKLLDEIDARASLYVQGAPYHYHDYESDTGRVRAWCGSGEPTRAMRLSTSRDALALFRPDTWWIHEIAPNQFIGERRVGDGQAEAWVLSDVCMTPELAELHCMLLAWQYDRERFAAGEPARPGLRYAAVVRFTPTEARMLDFLASGARVPSTVMAQRLAAHALFDNRMREAAHQGSPSKAGSSPDTSTYDRA